ncbi:MAG: dTDP-4-dehydrorhamnose reductase [Burkholderiaceae bacterium]
MRILLLGKNGQVGWELQRSLAPLGELVACGSADADLGELSALASLVRRVKPQLIVNAAAHTAVDRCESEPERAMAINAGAPGLLAREAAALDALLVHYSTDYVFDGSGSAPWIEDDATGPVNVYGRSKLDGEEAIRASGCRHLILRTSWVYAARGGNFARTMLRLAAERQSLNVIHDQIGAPTGAELIADVTSHAVRGVMQRPGLAGTYHLAAAGATSWHGYATHVVEAARGRAASTVKVVADAIHAVPSSAFPTPARRPMNSRLDCSKLQRAFELQLPDWRAGVDRLLAELLPPTNQGTSSR